MSAADLVPRRALDAERWPAFAVDRGGVILFANRAWDRTAVQAGGPCAGEVVGTDLLAHIQGDELRRFHEDLLVRLFSRGVAEQGDAPCNTPDRYRLFRYRFEPVPERGRDAVALVVELSTLIAEGLLSDRYRVAPPDADRYRRHGDLIVQCSGCRRVLVAGSDPREWELVPEYVAAPPARVSHAICELCRELYYGARHAGR